MGGCKAPEAKKRGSCPERRPESGRGAAGFRQSLIARHASITASDNANLHINSVQTLFLRKCIRKSCAAWLSKAGKRVAAAYSNPWFPEDTVTTQPRSSRIQSNGRLRSCFKFIFRPSGGDLAGWRGVFQRRMAKLPGVKNASKTRNSPRWANKILNPLPENSAFSDCKKFKTASQGRRAISLPSVLGT